MGSAIFSCTSIPIGSLGIVEGKCGDILNEFLRFIVMAYNAKWFLILFFGAPILGFLNYLMHVKNPEYFDEIIESQEDMIKKYGARRMIYDTVLIWWGYAFFLQYLSWRFKHTIEIMIFLSGYLVADIHFDYKEIKKVKREIKDKWRGWRD